MLKNILFTILAKGRIILFLNLGIAFALRCVKHAPPNVSMRLDFGLLVLP